MRAMGIKTVLPPLLFALTVSAYAPIWTAATVVSVSNRPARYRVPAAVEYTVRIDNTEYVVEQARRPFSSQGPKEMFAPGEAVELTQDGEDHVFLRKGATDQKRFRIVRVVRH